MKILITGGAGYVGGALTDILGKTEHSVKVYDSLLYEESYRKDVDFVFGDIRDRDKLKRLLKWADAVVWLAAIVGDGACALNSDAAIDINEESVKWLSKNYDGRIIFTSTCSVYGAYDRVLNELSPTNPLSVYASSKLASEKYLKDKNSLIFRLGTLFGVGDRFSRIRLDLVVNIMTVRANNDGILRVFGGKQYRPLLHVKDSAQAIYENLKTSHTGIFNLNKQNINILDLSQIIKKHFPKVKIIKEDIKFEDARNYKVDNIKAKKILNFRPKLSIDQGVEELKRLLREERIVDINNPRYGNQAFLTKFGTNLNKVYEKNIKKPTLIEGGISEDKRGSVGFVNGFNFSNLKRFYVVRNQHVGMVRAWHGHKNEDKYVFVASGKALIGAVKIDSWVNPSKKAKVYSFILSSKKLSVLHIPKGYANGFKSLTSDAKLIFFSTSTLEQSKEDDFRFDSQYWNIWD